MQKKDWIINIILAALAIVLLVLCVRSVTREIQTEKKTNEIIDHVRNQ
jgi:uncharacterized protein YoxC